MCEKVDVAQHYQINSFWDTCALNFSVCLGELSVFSDQNQKHLTSRDRIKVQTLRSLPFSLYPGQFCANEHAILKSLNFKSRLALPI